MVFFKQRNMENIMNINFMR